MMKKTMLVVFAIGILVLLSTYTIDAAEGNILKNPGFELSQNGVPNGWNVMNGISPDAKMELSKIDPHSGASCLTIENINPADTMVIQNLDVKPEEIYKVSGWLKTENIQNQPGSANITLYYVNNGYGCKGIYTSTEYQNTGNKWVKIEFYIRTLKESAPLTLGIRLGGQGTKNKGKVSFDDLRFELSKDSNVTISGFFVPDGSSSNLANNNTQSTNTASTGGASTNNILYYIIFGVLGLGLLVYLEFKFSKKGTAKLSDEDPENEEENK